MRTLVIEQIT